MVDLEDPVVVVVACKRRRDSNVDFENGWLLQGVKSGRLASVPAVSGEQAVVVVVVVWV